MTDICCIGHLTVDNIITPGHVATLNGGTAFYFTRGISRLKGISYKLITSVADDQKEAIDDMRDDDIDIKVIPSEKTVVFENIYGENMDNRQQRVLAEGEPFTVEKLQDVEARFIHLGSLLSKDFSLDVIKYLSTRGTLSVDAQGFLRKVEGKEVEPCDWKEKRKALPYIDILKVNEHEIDSLTGFKDARQAAVQLAIWGVKEVLITLGSYGSMIYAGGNFYEIPAYEPDELVDATGCGDTYAAGYLYMRSRGADYEECGRFAAAMATLKLENSGPFNGDEDDIRKIMDED
ncbi:MAG: PfkB family carbohydrate kinase [Muribaculaceae bacterium]|jgi:sugar/nucleoside kinase (ribokinase family)|nr:PfkB family carbohydrate kinase [Muribaculaceae bacterium]